jgi:hypothetical protein
VSSGRQKGRGISSPAAPRPPSFPRPQAARGTATVWEQMHDSICAVDSVRRVDQMTPTLRSLVRRSFPDTR